MRIGILTYHAVCNFGANLQVLSTVSYLKNKGYEPIVIDWLLDSLDEKYKRSTPIEQYNEHVNFRNKYLPMTIRCKTSKEVAEVIEASSIEAVIVGSDATLQHFGFWSRVVFPSRRFISYAQPPRDQMCPNPYWGSFYKYLKKTIKLCMMSVSSQNAPYKSYTSKELAYLDSFLQNFDYISTRDSWTASMVKRITSARVIPVVTPDPVFAFNQNVLEQPTKEDILKKFSLPEKYILVSFHNSKTVSLSWLKEFQKIANQNNVKCVAFPFPQGIEFVHPFNKEILLPLSPMDWYALIKYAYGYVGHNMHPIVVSLHNAVPCFSFDNYGIVKYRLFVDAKSSKIHHIMNEFGLAKNCFPCRSVFKTPPSPEYVFDAINTFDKKKVYEKSDEYLSSYNKMMRDIEDVIKR